MVEAPAFRIAAEGAPERLFPEEEADLLDRRARLRVGVASVRFAARVLPRHREDRVVVLRERGLRAVALLVREADPRRELLQPAVLAAHHHELGEGVDSLV